MSNWEGLNRRKFPRVHYPCLVIVRNNQNKKKEVILSHTENVGIGGVCMILKKSLKVLTPVELEIDLLDLGNHIKCKGKVAWNVQRKVEAKSKPLFYDIGIEFDGLAQEEHQRLQDIVSRLGQTDSDSSSI